MSNATQVESKCAHSSEGGEMDNKKRIILTFVIGFGMWVVFGAISFLLVDFVPPIVRSKLHNEELAQILAQMSYFLIPWFVMGLPFALAVKGTETLDPFSGGSSRVDLTAGFFKLLIMLFLAFSKVGWILMGYWTGKSLLKRLEERGIVKISEN